MGSDLRVVIFGYGLAGRCFHAPLIRATEGMNIAGIVTGDNDRARQARQDNPGVEIHANAESAFAHPDDYDMAVIAGANSSHAPLSFLAIEAGWHGVVDKPFAPNALVAREILTTAVDRNLKFTAFHNRRWDSDFLTVDALLRSASIGPVHRFESRLERLRAVPRNSWKGSSDPADMAGLLLDFGSHLIDQALQLMGPVGFVDCWTRNVREVDSPVDDLHITLFHTSGGVSELTGSQASVFAEPRFTVLGLQGESALSASTSRNSSSARAVTPPLPDSASSPPSLPPTSPSSMQTGSAIRSASRWPAARGTPSTPRCAIRYFSTPRSRCLLAT